MSTTSAMSHSAPCTQPSQSAATATSDTPTAAPHPRLTTERRSSGSSVLAMANSPMWAARTTA